MEEREERIAPLLFFYFINSILFYHNFILIPDNVELQFLLSSLSFDLDSVTRITLQPMHWYM
jgi:hypothetical protein